jgi:hypothetical protein
VHIQQVVHHIREVALRTVAEEGSLEVVGRKAFVVAVKAERQEQAPGQTVG